MKSRLPVFFCISLIIHILFFLLPSTRTTETESGTDIIPAGIIFRQVTKTAAVSAPETTETEKQQQRPPATRTDTAGHQIVNNTPPSSVRNFPPEEPGINESENQQEPQTSPAPESQEKNSNPETLSGREETGGPEVDPFVDLMKRIEAESINSYPLAARKRGQQGKVHIRIVLDENGLLDSAEIIKSSGYILLDNAAVSMVQEVLKTPCPHKLGTKVSLKLPVNYRLNG